jgi:pimeloyl-ACP methyl ester carboxylesterase
MKHAKEKNNPEDVSKLTDLADKSMIIIKDAGHSPFVDQPERFQEAVSSLLSRVKYYINEVEYEQGCSFI